MRVAIVGSRGYPNLNEVRDFVGGLNMEDTVISGGASGVDSIAERTALESLLEVVSFRVVDRDNRRFSVDRWQLMGEGPATSYFTAVRDEQGRPVMFTSFGRAAYFRNNLIVAEAERVVAFWDGESSGTFNSIELALAAHKQLEVRIA